MKYSIWLLLTLSMYGYPNGSRVPNGNAGEPGTGTPCASCHTVTLNPAGGKADLSGALSYSPGVKQRWTVSVTDPDSSKLRAFQLTASAGTFTALTGTVVNATSGRQYVNHSATAASFNFEWTPPASGDVTVWLAGVAARGTRQTNVYTTSVTLTPTGVSSSKPVVNAPDGVTNGASFVAGISAGSWVTIKGSNLAPTGVARWWRGDEIVNGALPTELEGTRVRINGKAAAIGYVSEKQLNVQAPDDESRGTVAVEVTTAAGTSDQVTADLRALAPALFRFDPSNGRYVAAVHLDGVYAGPADLYGGAVTLRPAQAGNTILLFGTGFGATNPAVPALRAFEGAAPLTGNARIRIGGVEAPLAFAGLSAPGLYQFTIAVPQLAAGEHLVEASVDGVNASGTLYLVVR